jgi:hypothetical protein
LRFRRRADLAIAQHLYDSAAILTMTVDTERIPQSGSRGRLYYARAADSGRGTARCNDGGSYRRRAGELGELAQLANQLVKVTAINPGEPSDFGLVLAGFFQKHVQIDTKEALD